MNRDGIQRDQPWAGVTAELRKFFEQLQPNVPHSDKGDGAAMHLADQLSSSSRLGHKRGGGGIGAGRATSKGDAATGCTSSSGSGRGGEDPINRSSPGGRGGYTAPDHAFQLLDTNISGAQKHWY
jgi:hypothetical protein